MITLLIIFNLITYVFPSAPTISAIPLYKEFNTEGFIIINAEKDLIIKFQQINDDKPWLIKKDSKRINFSELLDPSLYDQAKNTNLLIREMKNEKGDTEKLFVVNTKSGAAGYLKNIKDEADKWQNQLIEEKPFHSISSEGDNFTIFMHYKPSGETDGVYLYNLTKGKIIFLQEIQKMQRKYQPLLIENMPIIKENTSTAEIHSGKKGARCHLLINNQTGEIYWIEVDMENPNKIYARKEKLNLFKSFTEGEGNLLNRKFILIPLLTTYDSTWDAFIINSQTGEMAKFENVHDYKNMKLKLIKAKLDNLFEEKRAKLLGIPKIKKGYTKGLWLYNIISEEVSYLENIDKIKNLKIKQIIRSP